MAVEQNEVMDLSSPEAQEILNQQLSEDTTGTAEEIKEKPEEEAKEITDKKEETKEDEKKEDELSLDDPENKKEDDDDSVKEEDTEDEKKEEEPKTELQIDDFQSILKDSELEIDLTDNTKEGLIEGLKGWKEKVKETIKQEVLTDVHELKDFSPEAKLAIQKMNQGTKWEEIQNPGGSFDNFILMNDKDLMTANLMAGDKGVSEEEAQLQVEEMEENGTLSEYSQNLRNSLKSSKAEYVNKQTAEFTKAVEDAQKELLLADKAYLDKSTDFIRKNTKFGEFEIPNKVNEILVANWQNPEGFRKRIEKDPEFAAEVYRTHMLHNVAIKTIKERGLKEGAKAERDKAHEKNYNPSSIKKDDKRIGKSNLQAEGFEALAAEFDKGVSIERRN